CWDESGNNIRSTRRFQSNVTHPFWWDQNVLDHDLTYHIGVDSA
ncbi:MAG: hypothetical protein QOG25_2548, partial [Acetobacteraceae bacterium]|nr:hypothetical protein [Acetobacteraceae bacterium]